MERSVWKEENQYGIWKGFHNVQSSTVLCALDESCKVQTENLLLDLTTGDLW